MPEPMTFWEDVLHRRSCRDLDRILELEWRIKNLERPWWKRLLGVGKWDVGFLARRREPGMGKQVMYVKDEMRPGEESWKLNER